MDEFTVRIELYKGRRTHKKKSFAFLPHLPPSMIYWLSWWLYPNRRSHLANTEVAAAVLGRQWVVPCFDLPLRPW